MGAIEEQVAAIYCGVRGFLDKVDPAQITTFEQKFMEHVKATQRPLLDQIGKHGHLQRIGHRRTLPPTATSWTTSRMTYEFIMNEWRTERKHKTRASLALMVGEGSFTVSLLSARGAFSSWIVLIIIWLGGKQKKQRLRRSPFLSRGSYSNPS